MQTATITIKKIYPGSKPNAPARALDTNGVYWKLWSKERALVEDGGTYLVSYKTENWEGKDQYMVTSVGPNTAPKVSAPAPAPVPAPMPMRWVSAPDGPTPSTQSHLYKDEEIACLAIIKCFEAMPFADPQAVENNLKAAALGLRKFRAWQKSRNIESGPASKLNDDEIPPL